MKSKQLLYLGLVPLLFTAGQQAIAETAETGDTAKAPVALAFRWSMSSTVRRSNRSVERIR